MKTDINNEIKRNRKMTEEERKLLKNKIEKSQYSYFTNKLDELYNPELSDFYEISPELDAFILKWVKQINKELYKLPQETINNIFTPFKYRQRGTTIEEVSRMMGLELYENFQNDLEDITEELKNKFGFDEKAIRVYDLETHGKEALWIDFEKYHQKIHPNVLVDVIVANVMHDKYTLGEFMNKHGYVIVRVYQEKSLFGQGTISHFIFASAKPRDITDEIHGRCEYLYHITNDRKF